MAEVVEAGERLFRSTDVQNYELSLPWDIPKITRQAEGFAETHIERYHRRLGPLIETLTNVGTFLRDISVTPSLNPRSYFQPMTATLAIGIPAICYVREDGTLHIRERELLRLYGHEGMGHGLQHAVAKSAGVPYFLAKDSNMTISTDESVGQFYERVIFDDLKSSTLTQKELGIAHFFDTMYQEEMDTRLLTDYERRLSQYAITVLADKDLGDPRDPNVMKRKSEAISEVSVNPSYGFQVVQQNANNFDYSGNLNPALVAELRYCAQPVQRALAEFAARGIEYEGKGRSRIDSVLLLGHWTPIGYVEHARIMARS